MSKYESDGGLRDHIRLEQEERARTMLESGDICDPSNPKFPSMTQGGMYSGILCGIVGENEEIHQQHLRGVTGRFEALFPEGYILKKSSKKKSGSYGDRYITPGATHISKEEFRDLYDAVCFANSFGVVMNVHITIHWGLLGYEDHVEAAKVLQDGFFKPFHGWYKYNVKQYRAAHGKDFSEELCWIYSHECSRRNGFHTHILAGMPVEMRKAFREWVRRRVASLAKIKPVPKEVVHVVGPPSDPIGRQWRLFQYLCKGLDPHATIEIPGYANPKALSLMIENAYADPGKIMCKNRVGLSRNLSRKAREAAQFNPLPESDFRHKGLIYTAKFYEDWQRKMYEQKEREERERMRYELPACLFDSILKK